MHYQRMHVDELQKRIAHAQREIQRLEDKRAALSTGGKHELGVHRMILIELKKELNKRFTQQSLKGF